MKYQFKASRAFWKSFSKLPEQQQVSAKGLQNFQSKSF